ncbi:protein of unknown function [Limnospira indica PCC 8005]|uniref:Uncharacterized protein n=1 Tax=Limnospira indica PCC 8005 TaxID=376219 RepID=A0A9P1KHJ4_9CYAN|nr:protein of unknown function [Limnospira indica PCC 8005]
MGATQCPTLPIPRQGTETEGLAGDLPTCPDGGCPTLPIPRQGTETPPSQRGYLR